MELCNVTVHGPLKQAEAADSNRITVNRKKRTKPSVSQRIQRTGKEYLMTDKITVKKKLDLLITGFRSVLYEKDEEFLTRMRADRRSEEDIRKLEFWEWPQGVGLYGIWKVLEQTGEPKLLDLITEYYDRQLLIGLPVKNVNTTAPLLTLSFLAEYTGNGRYLKICTDWADWILKDFPRTSEGGFQHLTTDSVNSQELWDDTLFMTVLFLANMGRIMKRSDYSEEALYQFLLHGHYLADPKTGLWYHGWTFHGNHNYAGAFWARGNCWITAAIPEYLQIADCPPAARRYLTELLNRQAESLRLYQAPSGMWNTLIDDASSYEEASATCGFGYGMLSAVRLGILAPEYGACAFKALDAVLECITPEGTVAKVSGGTAMGRESLDFYKSIPIKSMPYGQSLAILYLLEVMKEETL